MKNTDIITDEYSEVENGNCGRFSSVSSKIRLSKEDKHKCAALCMIITVVSLLGYIVENIFTIITAGYIDNRNMFLPLLLGYGVSMIVIYLLFGTPAAPRFCKFDLSCKNNFLNTLVYFALTFAIVSVGEIILGTIVEHWFNIVWWNYTSLPMNITKYTSVPTSAAFGAMITFFMGVIFMPLYKAFMKINHKTLCRLAVVFMVLLSADFIHSGIVMFNTGDIMHIWKITF